MILLKKAAAVMLAAATLVTMAACDGGGTTTVPNSTQKPTVSTNISAENGEQIIYDNTSSGFRLTYPSSWLAVDSSNLDNPEVLEKLQAMLQEENKIEEVRKKLGKQESLFFDTQQPTTFVDVVVTDTVSTKPEELTSPVFQNQYESQVKNADAEEVLVGKVQGLEFGGHYYLYMVFEKGDSKLAHAMTVQNGSMYVFVLQTEKQNFEPALLNFRQMLESVALTK